MQTPGADIARNLASFGNLFIRDGDGTESRGIGGSCSPSVSPTCAAAAARRSCASPCRACASHSGPDNQRGYRTDAEIAADVARDPMPRLRAHLVPSLLSESEWNELEAEVARDVQQALDAARARPVSGSRQRRALGLRRRLARIARSVRRTLARRARERSTAAETRGRRRRSGPIRRSRCDERCGTSSRSTRSVSSSARTSDVKGGVHLVTEGLQKQFGDQRVFDTSLSEEGIIGRAVGMAICGLMPVAEIQFRKYADPATEQLNNCGTLRWRTANRFAAPIVVRMPGGFGKDVGDPWHSLSDEVRFAHAYGWQVAMPSNAADAAGLLRAGDARRESDDLLRAPLAADDERRQRALSGRRLRACRSAARAVRRPGSDRDARDVGRAGPSMCRSGRAIRRSCRSDRPPHDRAVGSRVRARFSSEDGSLRDRPRGQPHGRVRRRDRGDGGAAKRSGSSMRRSIASPSRTCRCRITRYCSRPSCRASTESPRASKQPWPSDCPAVQLT